MLTIKPTKPAMQQKASEQEAEKVIFPNHPFLEQFVEFANQNPDIKEKLMVFKAIAAIPGQNHRLFLIGKGSELTKQEKKYGTEISIQTIISFGGVEKKYIIYLNEEELKDYKEINPSLFQLSITSLY
jgi:hypothetical protein